MGKLDKVSCFAGLLVTDGMEVLECHHRRQCSGCYRDHVAWFRYMETAETEDISFDSFDPVFIAESVCCVCIQRRNVPVDRYLYSELFEEIDDFYGKNDHLGRSDPYDQRETVIRPWDLAFDLCGEFLFFRLYTRTQRIAATVSGGRCDPFCAVPSVSCGTGEES